MGNELDTRLAGLIDRQAIADCLARFCRGMDRFDRDAYLSAFHADAEIAAGPFVGSAADCWDWAMPLHDQAQSLTHHVLLQSSIDVDGDTAHGETYYQFIGRNRDDSVIMAGGRYIDRFERRDGAWRIALRVNVIEWSVMPPAVAIPFADVPDIAANGVSARGREDPSYQRPLVNRRARQRPDAAL
ncbi:nuclear transport factor 2 family protein (plasmid) [Sphingobium sp. V4]|jgi:hypothetical protein|uniref:nuclear transport factor 2 family protein n=1 Tax=Sphingobium sp. V4 TaxID=3038927 RepID=UPI002557CBD4|nr:nuclear transport factor 2 family protein [Sphingobium sp. V4]WIW90768.1 nuclear transport factor 2 family protein [Sphingobium sp. V4]